jgi:hypothetical protein
LRPRIRKNSFGFGIFRNLIREDGYRFLLAAKEEGGWKRGGCKCVLDSLPYIVFVLNTSKPTGLKNSSLHRATGQKRSGQGVKNLVIWCAG